MKSAIFFSEGQNSGINVVKVLFKTQKNIAVWILLSSILFGVLANQS